MPCWPDWLGAAASIRDVVGQNVVVDILLDRCVRGFGLEADLVRQGLQVMEEHWGNQIRLALMCESFTKPPVLQSARSFEQQPPSSPSLADVGAESLALPPSRITVLSDRPVG